MSTPPLTDLDRAFMGWLMWLGAQEDYRLWKLWTDWYARELRQRAITIEIRT